MSDLSSMYRSDCANCKALRARVAELEADDGRMFTDQARWIALAMRMEADRDRWKAEALAAMELLENSSVNPSAPLWTCRIEATQEQDLAYSSARAANGENTNE